MSFVWNPRYHNWRCRRRVNGRTMQPTFTYMDNTLERRPRGQATRMISAPGSAQRWPCPSLFAAT
jgi:hypothetical protein